MELVSGLEVTIEEEIARAREAIDRHHEAIARRDDPDVLLLEDRVSRLSKVEQAPTYREEPAILAQGSSPAPKTKRGLRCALWGHRL